MSSVRFQRLAGSSLTPDLGAPSCRAASKRCIGSFCQERTFAVADASDRAWSEAANQSLHISMSAYRNFIFDSGQSQVSNLAATSNSAHRNKEAWRQLCNVD